MAHRAALVALLVLFALVHFGAMGDLGFTWDEGGDLAIVACLRESGDPFACTADISQTRLPFYVHALLGRDHLISIAFSALTLLVTYEYARRRHGSLAATLFASLYVTSPAMLAAGRMVLTHSHIICTTFSTLSFLALFEYNRTGRRRWFIACAIGSGLAAASSVLGVFNAVVLLAFYTRRSIRDLVFLPVAAATFFVTTIVYVKPELLGQLIYECTRGGDYPFWNYLGLHSPRAPWFFPFVLLLVKAGVWVIPALFASRRFAVALLILLTLKGAVFGYETPHHQSQFYPLLYLFAGAGIASALRSTHRRWAAAAVGVAFVVQLYDVVRFFPNYLFHGAQYGERFIGEFYGPAVLHAQGRAAVWREIDAIVARDPGTRFLIADHSMLERTGANFVPFTTRGNSRYDYALVDRLYATHFHFPERDAFNELLAREYRPVFTTCFPTGKWVYRVMKRITPGTPPQSPPARPSSSDTCAASSDGSPWR